MHKSRKLHVKQKSRKIEKGEEREKPKGFAATRVSRLHQKLVHGLIGPHLLTKCAALRKRFVHLQRLEVDNASEYVDAKRVAVEAWQLFMGKNGTWLAQEPKAEITGKSLSIKNNKELNKLLWNGKVIIVNDHIISIRRTDEQEICASAYRLSQAKLARVSYKKKERKLPEA